MKVLLLEQPGSPQLKYVASELTARSATITWTVENGNSAITGYEIQFAKLFLTSRQRSDYSRTKGNQSLINQSSNGDSNLPNLSDLDSLFKRVAKESQDDEFWSQANVQFVSSTDVQESSGLQSNGKSNGAQLIGQYSLTKLEPSSLYLIRLKAQNPLGFSKYSNVIFVWTKKESPSLLPQNVTCTTLNSRSIRVYWQIPRQLSAADTKKQLQPNSIGQRISQQLIEGSFVRVKRVCKLFGLKKF